MIHTNLSTRPFYNNRAVSLWIALLTLVVAAVTLFNVERVFHYSQSDSALGSQTRADLAKAAEDREAAAKLRTSVDARQVALVSVEARKANDLIDRRTFSWTDLLNQFELTLPADVRITTVRPHVNDNRTIVITVVLVAREVDDVNQFMENLEKTESFTHLLVRDERMNEEDQLEATLEAVYKPHAPEPPSAPPPEAPR